MKLSDYVIQFLVDQGIRHVFLVSGGAVAHLVDSASRNPNMTYVCSQHEQNAGAAADGYSRVTENLGAVLVTSGPGATNLVTSVCNAYFDSIPAIFICGQVATFRLRPNKKLRQKGFQETDVISIFESITNYAVLVRKAEDIRFELEKAVYLAKAGRPAPVVIDIPDDLQRADIDPKKLRRFKPKPQKKIPSIHNKIKKLFSWIEHAKRPVLVLGAGVRISKSQKEMIAFARYFHLPMLLTWGGKDILPHTDELNMGGLGVCGPRAGNFAVQNADLVIGMGTRFSQMITGGKPSLFAPKAKKVMVDIDAAELNKFTPKEIILDLTIQCDLWDFFTQCQKLYKSCPDHFKDWRRQIKAWDEKYPICPKEYYDRVERVDAYVFIKKLSAVTNEGAVVIIDTGGNVSWTMQAFETKQQQHLFSAWNHTPMGYALPASVGASLASGQDIICIIGDGGLMMCIQELATLKRYKLPVKIFVFNNHGHGIQKQTLDTWLDSHYVAVDEKSGLSFPDFVKVGEAFGIPSCSIDNHSQIDSKLKEVLNTPGPILCNVEIVENQKIIPMLKFGAGLEDLDPKLPKQELEEIMKISKS